MGGLAHDYHASDFSRHFLAIGSHFTEIWLDLKSNWRAFILTTISKLPFFGGGELTELVELIFFSSIHPSKQTS
jgi:hypothetical protein